MCIICDLYMILINLAAPSSEISNQFLKELINLKYKFSN
jgi:hypothetical protein